MSADKEAGKLRSTAKKAVDTAGDTAHKVADSASKTVDKATDKASEAVHSSEDSIHKIAGEAWSNGEALFHDASQLVASLRQGQEELGERLTSGTQSRPYLAAGAAMGLGFILGGGLTLGITQRLVAVGSRLAVSMVVRKVMENASKMAT